MGLEIPVFAYWFILFLHQPLTKDDNVVSLCFRLGYECHCGVFRNTMAEEPIISHSRNFVMPCDKGRESCSAICTGLVSVCQHSVPETKIMTQTETLYSSLLPCNNSQERVEDHLCFHHTPLWCRQKFTIAFYLQNQILSLSAHRWSLQLEHQDVVLCCLIRAAAHLRRSW
jgi:hypothetical protein